MTAHPLIARLIPQWRRGGSTDAPVTADALVFQAELPGEEAESAACPQLRMPVTHGTNIERFAPVEARFVRFTVLGTTLSQPCIDELEVFTAEDRPRHGAPPRRNHGESG